MNEIREDGLRMRAYFALGEWTRGLEQWPPHDNQQQRVEFMECARCLDDWIGKPDANLLLRRVTSAIDLMAGIRTGRTRSRHKPAVRQAIKDLRDSMHTMLARILVLGTEDERERITEAMTMMETPPMKLQRVVELLGPTMSKPYVQKRVARAVREIGGELVGTPGRFRVRWQSITVPHIRKRFEDEHTT